MEILYIYIHDYKKIQKQNINFGGKYRFHYDYESKELTVSENHQYIEGFYDKHQDKTDFARITNLTSIIGENGVGKTSVLDFIKENFVSGGTIEKSFICAIYTVNGIELLYFEVPIFKDNCNQFEITKIEINQEPMILEKTKKTFGYIPPVFPIDDSEFIYFSNIFDNRYENELKGSHNLSTNFLIKNDHLHRVEMGISERNDPVLEIHRFEEIFRQIQFISNYNIETGVIPFDLPEKLTLKLTKNRFVGADSLEFRLKNKLAARGILDNYNSISTQTNRLMPSSRIKNSDFIEVIVGNAFINCLEEMFSINLDAIDNNLNEFSKELELFLKNSKSIKIKDILEKAQLLASRDSLLQQTRYANVFERILKFYDFLIKNADVVNKISLGLFAPNELYIEFNITEKNLFKAISQAYSGTYILKPYLDFEWRNLSSGENALLSIYARFSMLCDLAKFGDKLKDNLIILMDEPDTNLHPQWQKTLLNSLLDFLPEIYGRKDTDGEKIKQRNIQIIFTTNNPISASDLLASNTIFMKLDNHKNVQIQDSLTDQRQTFGANIYSLYADSFFIQDGLMGKFASEKINAIIKTLNSLRPLNAQERETMRRTISQIGEPAIKNKLIQMYSDRFNMDIHERLDNIEKKLNKDDQDKPK